jgi:uncharacterized protein (DUF488 family)
MVSDVTEIGPIYALGHSTRSQEELLDLLRRHGVCTLADIRTFPRSRRNPQFNREELAGALSREGIRYVHLPRLGGRRKGLGEASPNRAWRNPGFRGYADYMQTAEFAAGLAELLALAAAGPVAMMCAEAVPWRCHRSLVADALLARGIVVRHLQGGRSATPHRLTPFARIAGDQVTYPGEAAEGGGASPVGPALPPEPSDCSRGARRAVGNSACAEGRR